MLKKTIGVVLSTVIIFTSFVSAYSDNLTALINQLKNKETQIKANETLMSGYDTEYKELSDKVILLSDELIEIKGKIDELTIVLDDISKQLDDAIAKEEEKKGVFHKRLRAMYESGNENNFEKILDSDDIMSATRKAEIIREVSEYDKKILDEMSEIREGISKIKDEYQQKLDEQNELQKELDRQLQEKSAELQVIDDKIKERRAKKLELLKEKKDIETEIYKETYWGKVETEAKQYLDYPYVWGGSTPETSFDCSGFVCWVLNDSGVYNIPRTSAQGIYDKCDEISPDEVMPGDIIFFTGTYDSGDPVSHVGFYAGDNKMLHCGNPIQYARIDTDYWKKHFYAFGRLKNLK